MGRIEEAINVVHILADQVPMSSDRRRVFPLVVRALVESDVEVTVPSLAQSSR